MKFLVELYRYLILGFVGLIIIGVTYGLASGISDGFVDHPLGPIWILGMLSVLLFIILGVGGIAVVISIYDRHSEMVEQTERIADALERLEHSKTENQGE